MEWISVEKYLPGTKAGWVIVRCVDKNREEEFHFMASYYHGWEYFDDDKDYENAMIITHWMVPEKIDRE